MAIENRNLIQVCAAIGKRIGALCVEAKRREPPFDEVYLDCYMPWSDLIMKLDPVERESYLGFCKEHKELAIGVVGQADSETARRLKDLREKMVTIQKDAMRRLRIDGGDLAKESAERDRSYSDKSTAGGLSEDLGGVPGLPRLFSIRGAVKKSLKRDALGWQETDDSGGSLPLFGRHIKGPIWGILRCELVPREFDLLVLTIDYGIARVKDAATRKYVLNYALTHVLGESLTYPVRNRKEVEGATDVSMKAFSIVGPAIDAAVIEPLEEFGMLEG